MSKKRHRAKGYGPPVVAVYIDEVADWTDEQWHQLLNQRELRPVSDLPAPPEEPWPFALLGPRPDTPE